MLFQLLLQTPLIVLMHWQRLWHMDWFWNHWRWPFYIRQYVQGGWASSKTCKDKWFGEVAPIKIKHKQRKFSLKRKNGWFDSPCVKYSVEVVCGSAWIKAQDKKNKWQEILSQRKTPQIFKVRTSEYEADLIHLKLETIPTKGYCTWPEKGQIQTKNKGFV